MDPTETEIGRLLAWRRGESPGPLRVHLVLTERCNLACRSCFMGRLPPATRDRELDDRTLLRLADQAIALGVAEFYLVGGEILIRRRIALELMSRIKAAGLRGELTTNGTLLDLDTVEHIVGIGWDRLQVSLDGPDPASNDVLRPPDGTFRRAVRGARRVTQARERAGAAFPELGLATVVSRENHRYLGAMVRLAGELGATEATFHALKDMSEECGSMALGPTDEESLADAVRGALRTARTLGVATNAGDLLQPALVEDRGMDAALRDDVDRIEDPFFAAHCFLPWTTLVVHFDGRVSPCWEWRGPELGNVTEMDLDAIWRGPVFRRWRRDFAAGQVPEHCAGCCLGFVDHIRWVRLEGLLAAGEFGEALAVADRLLAWQPAHRHAVVARAKALLGAGRGGEADAWVRECLAGRLRGRCVERAYLVDVLVRGGRLDAAAELAPQVLIDDEPGAGVGSEGGGPVTEAVRRLRDTLRRAGVPIS